MYNETIDLDKHIDVYTTQVSYTTKDVIPCSVFPTSLKGVALSWITCLPQYSIDCF